MADIINISEVRQSDCVYKGKLTRRKSLFNSYKETEREGMRQ